MWPMMDKPRLWRRRSDKGSIGFAASYCTFCAQDLRAPPCTRTPQEGARCGCGRYATGRKVVLSEGLVRQRKRHRACVGSLHMENKELPEMSGPQSEKSRVPVLRAAGGGDGETALDTLRLKSLAAAPPPPPIEQSDWQRYLTAALRHKWLVLAVTLVGTALGIVATRFLDPRYSAKAILWVDVAVGRDRGVPSDEILDSKGWLDLVTSNAVLDTVVKQRRLFLQPATPDDSAPLSSFDITDRVAPGKYRLIVDKAGRAMRLELEDGTVVQRGRVGQPIGDNVGFDWTPTSDQLKPGSTITFAVSAIPDASATLAKAIRARIDPAGNFLRLQLKGTSAANTAATLNNISTRIVAVEGDMKRRKFQELASVLNNQYDEAKTTLQQAEDALRSYRVRTADRPIITATPMGGLSVEGGNMATQLRLDMAQRRRDAQLLQREAQMAQDQYVNVGKQYEAAKLSLLSALPDVRILDPATEPLRPASDYGPLLILLAMMASFGVAVVGVNVRDKMDPKVRYPGQITGQMRLQILGAVPHVSWRLGANGDGPAQVIEALRGLRLRVLHAHAGEGPLTLTITSPGIGDGKSFVSLNLALSFADAGYRTLLVECDTRRGVQHKALKTPSTPGLTDVVAGRVPLDAALRQTSYPGLTFLSSGTRMQRAPERLLSQNMRDLMGKLRSMFDVVIVDSPPLGAGADPLVLGTLTENLMLVLRTGQSDLNLASTKLEVLNALPVRVIGAVLNDVRSSGVYRYYMYSSAG